MSKNLDVLLDNYISKICANDAMNVDVEDVEGKLILDSAKQHIKKSIYEEITAEIRDEALKQADEIIKEKVEAERIKEVRNLVIQGFVVSIFVGLLVNQITDIIGFYKGSVQLNSLGSTIWWVLGLTLICVAIFGYTFLMTLFEMLRRAKNAGD